jgi:hypothetical protein
VAIERYDFGIIIHRASQSMPHDASGAIFDAWFTVRQDADRAFDAAKLSHPDSIVHLVTRVRSEWREPTPELYANRQ